MGYRPGRKLRAPWRENVSTRVSSWLNFTPLSLQPELWLDASDKTTITEVSGAVSQWKDKSGNGRNYSQSTGSAQPTTGTVTQNGLNTIDFDGSADFLNGPTPSTFNFLHNGTRYLITAVVKSDTTGVTAYILGTSSNATGPGAELRYGTTTVDHIIRPTATTSNSGGTTNTNPIVVSIVSDAANATAADRSFLYLTNNIPIQNNTGVGTASTSNAQQAMTIGRRPTIAATFWNGWIGEIIIVSGTNAIETNRRLLADYLINKWGINP